jgi:molybdopterin-guanine dinucleotide biosynthesis protein A
MIGLLMAGGASKRMGTDKGLLLDKAGELWAKKTLELLEKGNLSCFVSLNSSQLNTYQAHFSVKSLVIDNPNIPVKGPLLGILSAHQQFPKEDLFALATDLPYLSFAQIERLLVFREQNPKQGIWVYRSHKGPEPLCAIYSARILAQILSTPPQKFSLTALLDQFPTAYLPILPEEMDNFENVNFPINEKSL